MEGLLSQSQQEPQPQGPQNIAVEDGGDAALIAGKKYITEQLYEGPIGDQVNKAIKGNQKPAKILAAIAYKLSQAADTHTNAEIADEDLVDLAMHALDEVFQIAEASNADASPQSISSAFKSMIVMFLQDQGVDPSQIEQAMAGISDDDFAKYAEQIPDEGVIEDV